MATSPQHFRFLDHPPELRLMVYEYLPVQSVTRTLRSKPCSFHKESLTLEYYRFQTALLATCKVVQKEAATYILRSMEALPPQLTHYCSGETYSVYTYELVSSIMVYIHAWRCSLIPYFQFDYYWPHDPKDESIQIVDRQPD